MLICNNCGCMNEDNALTCVNCRMQDGLSKLPGSKQEDGAVEMTMCVNCGNNFGSSLLRCPTCRFPVSKNRLSSGELPVIRNLKMG